MIRIKWPVALATMFVLLLGWYVVYSRQIVRLLRADAETLTRIYSEVTTGMASPYDAAAEDALKQDKLMLLTVKEVEGEFLIACRELDCHARSFGLVSRTRTLQLPRLPKACVQAVAHVFSPLVRVEQSRGRSATARVRAD